jgi:hypothetical protein
VKHREIILRLLLPTNENATESIHPAVRALDYPAASLESDVAPSGMSFLAAGANVSREAEMLRERADLIVVVSLVDAQSLLVSICWPGPSNPRTCNSVREHLEVISICGIDGQTDGYPVRLGQ